MNYGKARWSGRVLGLSLLVLAAGTLGCVEDVGLIDRTQPNKISKEMFRGVWYNVQTVVDVPPTSAFSFVGETYGGPASGASNKIVWDIQQNHLIVYPVFETIEGSERDYVVKRKIRNYWETDANGEIVDKFLEIYTGNPIASFAIESHFDVQRQYNPANGEESNVVEENTTDHKWWERKYIRVNWAKNEIADFGFITRSIESVGVDYYVQEWEEGNPDRPVLTDDLIMLTTKLFAQPTNPSACEAIQGSAYAADTDCAGAVIKVRTAFRKVPLNNDYVGQRYHVNLEQDKFGFFLSERHNYDDRYGITYEGKVSLINRFNLWEKSRTVAKEFPEAPCMFDYDCEGVADAETGAAANHCWQEAWFEEGHCVRWEILPLSERGSRPIVYHLSALWPDPVRTEAYQLADEYDEVFKDTIAWAKYWDERGMLHPKLCESNADCNAGALLDVEFDDQIQQYACRSQECAAIANTTCDATGWCAVRTPCGEGNPCKRGQVCKAVETDDGPLNVCHDGATPALKPIKRAEAITVVLYEDGGATKSLQIYGEGKRDPAQTDALVRFVNAAPGTTGAVLEARDFGTGDAVTIGTPANFDADLHTVPFHSVPMPAVGETAAGQTLYADEVVRHLGVKVGGQEVAGRTYVRLKRYHSYLVVFTGADELVVVENALASAGQTGVRVVDGLATTAKVDVAYNAALRGAGFEHGDATEWMAPPRDKANQRVTVVRTGDETNVSCYRFDGIGQCVGWKPAWGSEEAQRVATLRAELPNLYVLCENVYTGDTCDFDADGNPVDPTVQSDCRYSHKAGDTISNPCKDWVPDADRMKLHGDIRYSFLYWIAEDQAASPLGYGPSAADPDTGEIFYGIAHVYGGPMETYGTYARDLVWLVNGKKDDGTAFGEEDIISSRYVREYLDSVAPKGEYTSITGAMSAEEAPDDADAHMETRAMSAGLPQAFQHAMAATEPPLAKAPTIPVEFQRDMQVYDAAIQRGLRAGQRFASDNMGRARLDRIRGTWIEDLMINEEVKWGLTGQDPAAAASIDRNKLSPASWMTIEARDKEQERILNLARHNIMVADFADESLMHLAKQLGCDDLANETETTDMYDPDLGNGKCLSGQALRWGVMARIFGGTLEHEVGHTVGLRHNFTGSADPINFQDEYFAIREREIVGCPLIAAADGGIGPDNYCEAGEVCDPTLTCTTDDHCPNLTTCAKAAGSPTGKCLDLYGRDWGQCAAYKTLTRSCKADAECGDDLNVCRGGTCHTRFRCDTETPCEEGQRCNAAGLCTDGANAVVERVVETVSEKPLPVTKLVPRPAPTAREVQENRMEYQYSSLMDYGGGINFDMHGLGKYDRAALLFGYGELVEVWEDTSGFDAYIRKAADDANDPYYQWGWYKDTSYWKYAGVISHPFSYLNDLIGIENNKKRIAAPWRQVQLERTMVTSDYLRDATDLTWIEVPYKFCSDEYRGQLTMGGCYYFDLGADILEIVYHSIVKMREYYVFDAFKREMYGRNMGGNASGYFARILDRWMRPLGDTGMYWGLYAGVFEQIAPIYVDYYRHSTYNAYALDMAARTSLQTLAELISSPAPGTYVLDDIANRWVNVDYASKLPKDELKAGEANIPFGAGKFPYTTFLDEGYWRYDHALWIGSFWEKMAALLTLTDSSANFLSDYVGEQLNVGVGTSVGFNTSYAATMGNFLGGLVSGASEYSDGVMDPETREYRTRSILDLSSHLDETPTVPNGIDNLTMKLYAAVYGLSYMPAGFDPSFVDSLSVVIKGSGSQYDLGDSVETVEFTDPFGHKTYVAHRSNYDADVTAGGVGTIDPYDQQTRLDVAVRLIEQANATLAAYTASESLTERTRLGGELQKQVEVLDLLRTLNEIYGDIVY